MFTVSYIWTGSLGDCGDAVEFKTEREARAWINARADGSQVYTLEGPDHDIILQSSWPVLMVA